MNTERAQERTQEKKEHIFAFLRLDSQQINQIQAASLCFGSRRRLVGCVWHPILHLKLVGKQSI